MNIEGRNPVLELLRSDQKVDKIFLQEFINSDTKINAIHKKAKQKKIKIDRKPRKFLDHMSQTGVHQGVIAVINEIQHLSIQDIIYKNIDQGKATKFIYIREAFHEHNIGAIIRTAECAGFDAVILPPKIDLNPQIVRASMGATMHINVINESLFPLIKNLKKNDFKIIGIERTPDSSVYTEIDMRGNLMLIIGGEDKVLSEEIIKKCDAAVIIPMKGKVNSLNMSVAAALAIYESVRQETI